MEKVFLPDPDSPNKVRENKLKNIRPCIGDHEGLKRILAHKYLSCTVNRKPGMEKEYDGKPSDKKKSVLVVGGGPGGMEAVKLATLRGHKVTLWEKENMLGGNLVPSSVPDFKENCRRKPYSGFATMFFKAWSTRIICEL